MAYYHECKYRKRKYGRRMKRGISGHYETASTAGEAVRAFVPFPLPPDTAIALTGARARLHVRALLACGRLDAISALLPEPELFLYAYVRREALLSSQIDHVLFGSDYPFAAQSFIDKNSANVAGSGVLDAVAIEKVNHLNAEALFGFTR